MTVYAAAGQGGAAAGAGLQNWSHFLGEVGPAQRRLDLEEGRSLREAEGRRTRGTWLGAAARRRSPLPAPLPLCAAAALPLPLPPPPEGAAGGLCERQVRELALDC